ncbi:hypothetical protein Catovirus_2_40 [Catovirus CTV1]|mgnify:CR=1 FL=1|uniref:Uncharacterized protein n=1 Tax=Catovirus CTV1 TaxID=1977631 RepID=A0A1V0SBN8_9VIRU|nr:hypothetical protein Catovirus_2_40 [Catovirus CTV1]
MIRKLVNDKKIEYICGITNQEIIEKMNCICDYLPYDISLLTISYLEKFCDNKEFLKESFMNCEPYEIMESATSVGTRTKLEKVYNDLSENHVNELNHPDVIPFLVDNGITINDEIFGKIKDYNWGFNRQMSVGLIKNSLEYKVYDISRNLHSAISNNNLELAIYLLGWDRKLINNDDNFSDLLYAAISSWTARPLIFLMSMRQNYITPQHIIYAGYEGTLYHLSILVKIYLHHQNKRFIINKKISDKILTGLCGFDGIQLLKDNDFTIIEYDNILTLKKNNSLPEPTIKKGIQYLGSSSGLNSDVKKKFDIYGIPYIQPI